MKSRNKTTTQLGDENNMEIKRVAAYLRASAEDPKGRTGRWAHFPVVDGCVVKKQRADIVYVAPKKDKGAQ